MAKAEITVTDTFQQIATGAAVVTVTKRGRGAIVLNETATDVAAYKARADINEQFQQTQTVATHIRATGDGWLVVVDGVL